MTIDGLCQTEKEESETTHQTEGEEGEEEAIEADPATVSQTHYGKDHVRGHLTLTLAMIGTARGKTIRDMEKEEDTGVEGAAKTTTPNAYTVTMTDARMRTEEESGLGTGTGTLANAHAHLNLSSTNSSVRSRHGSPP